MNSNLELNTQINSNQVSNLNKVIQPFEDLTDTDSDLLEEDVVDLNGLQEKLETFKPTKTVEKEAYRVVEVQLLVVGDEGSSNPKINTCESNIPIDMFDNFILSTALKNKITKRANTTRKLNESKYKKQKRF